LAVALAMAMALAFFFYIFPFIVSMLSSLVDTMGTIYYSSLSYTSSSFPPLRRLLLYVWLRLSIYELEAPGACNILDRILYRCVISQ
jgi:hypothetical protein